MPATCGAAFSSIISGGIGASLRGDSNRIYFTGQSMGGMSSLQFATQDTSSSYFLGGACGHDLRPAAIVACSPGGSRNNVLDLDGKVMALVMQGSTDAIAPATFASGYLRNITVNETLMVYARKDDAFTTLIDSNTDDIVGKAASLLNVSADPPNEDAGGRQYQTGLVLQANAQTGGQFLDGKLNTSLIPGCADKTGMLTGIGSDFYMWEVLNTTVNRVVGLGNPVDMSTLTFTTTSGPASGERFQCADAGTAVGTSEEVRACVFNGGHTFPFVDSEPKVLHEYVWENFLRSGTVRRGQ